MKISRMSLSPRVAVFALCAIVVISVSGAVVYANRFAVRGTAQELLAMTQKPATEAFPNVDESALSDTQKRLLETLRAEYAKKPVSFDENVMVYTDGVEEPWCADFASWVMREIGQPYTNPHSGGWRIPGVYTLSEYYQAEGRYVAAQDHTPQMGDVALYIKTARESHTNIVLIVDTETRTMTTIGGNENGHMRLRTQSYDAGTNDLVGFGTLLP